jgi:hypothetical protein
MEANFARILLASGVGYEYEPKVFNLGPLGFYTPDFLLLAPLTIGDRVLVEAGWVELKGWRAKNGGLPGKAQEKIDAVGAVTGQTAIALAGRDPVWQALSGYWQSKIALWETPRKNLRTDPSLFAGLGR